MGSWSLLYPVYWYSVTPCLSVKTSSAFDFNHLLASCFWAVVWKLPSWNEWVRPETHLNSILPGSVLNIMFQDVWKLRVHICPLLCSLRLLPAKWDISNTIFYPKTTVLEAHHGFKKKPAEKDTFGTDWPYGKNSSWTTKQRLYHISIYCMKIQSILIFFAGVFWNESTSCQARPECTWCWHNWNSALL